jgi:Fe(3+) dicitrate transport protein
MQIVNPNFKIDENLRDETGFNFELGSRGNIKEIFGYDLSVFYLYYHDRIGAVLEQDPFDLILKRVRRNISDSRNIGIESYLEYDIWQSMIKDQSLYELILFTNVARIDARYVNSQEAAFQNKMVENVPKWNIKSGLNFKYKALKISSQVSYMSKQYTDATNAVESVPSAIYGEIPSYYILDLSSSYELKNNVTLETGVNNISNNMYFTRRAVGYPGPGIIPSDGRNFYLTLQLIF